MALTAGYRSSATLFPAETVVLRDSRQTDPEVIVAEADIDLFGAILFC